MPLMRITEDVDKKLTEIAVQAGRPTLTGNNKVRLALGMPLIKPNSRRNKPQPKEEKT